MLFELGKYKFGSHKKGNCLKQIAKSLVRLHGPFYNVPQKSIRGRVRLLETAFNPFTQPAYHYRSSAIDDVKNVLGFKKRTRNLTNKILS